MIIRKSILTGKKDELNRRFIQKKKLHKVFDKKGWKFGHHFRLKLLHFLFTSLLNVLALALSSETRLRNIPAK